jgi:hypothetical protein
MSNLSFSGSGANTSTAPGGYSGTLTFFTNVSVADGTAGNQVQSAVAPVVLRPNNATSGVMSNTTAAIMRRLMVARYRASYGKWPLRNLGSPSRECRRSFEHIANWVALGSGALVPAATASWHATASDGAEAGRVGSLVQREAVPTSR